MKKQSFLLLSFISLIVVSCFENPKKINYKQGVNTLRETKRETDEEINADLQGWIKAEDAFLPSDDYSFNGWDVISHIDGTVTLNTKILKADNEFDNIYIGFDIGDSLSIPDRETLVRCWVKRSADSLNWSEYEQRFPSIIDPENDELIGTGWGGTDWNGVDYLSRYYQLKIELDIGHTDQIVLSTLGVGTRRSQRGDNRTYLEVRERTRKQNVAMRKAMDEWKRKKKE